ncbi:MAG: alkaline phosphatase family protein [Leptospirales bacterium]
MKPRVFVIGLGGTSIALLKPWAEFGWLPNLDYLFRRGTFGSLVSGVPPMAIPEWAAILTGQNPGQTGLFDQIRKMPGSYFPQRLRFSSFGTDGIWSLVDRFRLSSALVNVPFISSGPSLTRTIGVHRVAMNDRNASSLFERALGRLGLLPRDKVGAAAGKTDSVPSGKTLRFLEKVTQDTILEGQILGAILESGTVDLVGVNFDGPDRILPRFWDELSALREEGPRTQLQEALLMFFKVLDDAVGKLVGDLKPADLAIVLSGHSFGPFRKLLSLNHFLVSRGLLRFRSGKGGESHFSRFASPFLRAAGIRRDPIKRIMGLLGVDGWLERVAPPFSSEIGLFDWRRSRAFSISRNGIHLNIRGLEPSGQVNPGPEARELGDEIIQALLELRDPHTGRPVIHKVCWRDQLYDGPHLGDLPHLVITDWDPGYMLAEFEQVRDRAGIFSDMGERNGSLRKEGFFLMAGPGLEKGVCVQTPLSIFDVLPTILRNFNQELPAGLDGRAFVGGSGLSGEPVGFGEMRDDRRRGGQALNGLDSANLDSPFRLGENIFFQ